MTVVFDNKEGDAATQTGESLRTITRLFTELQQLNFACCDVNSVTQCSILTTLSREGDQTLVSLTRTLNLDKAWLSRTTDHMVEEGLLIKAPHPGDRRALLLQLTDVGEQAAQSLNSQLNAQAQRVLDRLQEADRAQTVRLLESLKDALQAELQQEQCCITPDK
ncbi:MarR family transcriptional regulator [Deinococcus cavernae]|uniref:MarR family transcriptional regulator n=1 Tax=Deinococcus cavernae TaxID=2320857 RepID=A0A418VEG8_9DEIO|nr:MarR family transcriptional regulator [Deinococcus cavernae]RJF74507.1 MarR family transcriptional regulator [Deinococcus cavernae]